MNHSSPDKLKIALVSPFEEAVPPVKYGGSELVVGNLARELTRLGHEVHVLASGDSHPEGTLHAVVPRAIRHEPYADNPDLREAVKYRQTGHILEMLRDIDAGIVHNHIGWRMLPFTPFIQAPVITTLHGPLDTARAKFVYGPFHSCSYVSISNNQQEPFPELNYVATVYNGIDTSLFDFNGKSGDYLVFLGRISPEKGPAQAIRIAKEFGMKIVIAAKVDAVDRDYFEKEVKPSIDGKHAEFIGEVDAKGKNQLLRGAYAMLAPIQWREPFGLFLVEAMAAGTPVVATNMGAAPEIVQHGETGFVVDNNPAEFVSALRNIPSINRRACRERVERLFSMRTMAKGYVRAYESVIRELRIS